MSAACVQSNIGPYRPSEFNQPDARGIQLLRPAWCSTLHYKRFEDRAALCGKEPASRANVGWYLVPKLSRYRTVCASCAGQLENLP